MDWASILQQRAHHPAGGGGGNGGPAPPVVSFKAGKMQTTVKGGEGQQQQQPRYVVHADERRGVVQLEKREGITHFVWKDRQTLQVVDDFVVIPGDQTLIKVDTSRPDDRVYLLSFKTSMDRFFFYWMQDPDASKDEEKVQSLNRAMNEPPTTTPVMGGGRRFGGLGGGTVAEPPPRAVAMDDLESVLSGLGFAAPPPAPATTTTTTTTEPHVAPSSQDVVMSEASQSGTTAAAPTAVTEQDVLDALVQVARTPSLEKVVTSDSIKALLDDEAVAESLMRLLPPEHRTREELFHTTNSPHLISSLRAFSKVLNSEHLPSVLANFRLQGGDSFLARGDGIGAFLAAIEEYVQSHPNEDEQQGGGGGGGSEGDVNKKQ